MVNIVIRPTKLPLIQSKVNNTDQGLWQPYDHVDGKVSRQGKNRNFLLAFLFTYV